MRELKTLKDFSFTPEELAKIFHNNYEDFAKNNGWKTQESCKVKFENLPEKNKETMIDVCTHILLILEAKEKQEAIKWIKLSQDKIFELEKRANKGLPINKLEIWENIGKSNVLMDFFNITKGDLKCVVKNVNKKLR